jgi:S-adenosylmethionine synthetase
MPNLHCAEFVFPGHPDKLCDGIADALVEAMHAAEPRSLTGVEVAVHRSHVYVTGRLAGAGAQDIDLHSIVQDVYRSAGYGDGWHPAPRELEVVDNLCRGPLEEGESEFRAVADDQAICIGYANDLEAAQHLPVEHWVVGRFAARLHALRQARPDLGLGPDGKVIVGLEEAAGTSRRWTLRFFSCSLQQGAGADAVALHRAVRLAVEQELSQLAQDLPGLSDALPDELAVNGAGAFEVGGPEGDNGLSGKKLVMDAYGPRVPIGGGAWSGKDFFKADRAGGLHARRLAKLIVWLGLAQEARVTLAWQPGDRSARIVQIDTGGASIPVARIGDWMDLSLERSGQDFSGVSLLPMARWGHFSDAQLSWERMPRL